MAFANENRTEIWQNHTLEEIIKNTEIDISSPLLLLMCSEDSYDSDETLSS